ncbi:CheR family methyltransferase [Pedosphaera parvula]|uniref:MCP methyltransferase n=1 Tax=Pedosphaera parvula (strain Ellin514) TaxID=320771 RepID=B9XNN5_PEDPL|nr:CheR family methyltransferase [Pedosphaera parvula]EEF58575.1 MCP methyltransferase [Pedosphaera parvula Ellin514]
MNDIAIFLQQTIGLYAPTIGFSAIESAVRARMKNLGLSSKTDYLGALRASSSELNTLIDSVVVTETWFFRDSEPFSALVRLIKQRWIPGNHERPLRILSLPCSTGEEPYSIAMALLDSGLAATDFEIEAVDISTKALAMAERGLYQKNSFRSRNLGFRDRYFQLDEGGYLLSPVVRKQVRFSQGNILDERLKAGKEGYDYVFCRNLLIYFDRATQKTVFRRVSELLDPNGLAFFGSAELSLALANGFISAQMPLSFACRRAGFSLPAGQSNHFHKRAASNQESVRPLSDLTNVKARKQLRPARKVTHRLSLSVTERTLTDLNLARRLANAGLFAEAEHICRTYLSKKGVSAQAYYLMGFLRDVAGSSFEAHEFYRKALYLDPNHYDALTNLASLSQKNGHEAKAKLLMERAERVKCQV